MVTCNEKFSLDFWRIEIVKLKESQSILAAPKMKVVSLLINYNLSRNDELYDLLNKDIKVEPMAKNDGGYGDFENKLTESKLKEVFMCWNTTGTMLAVSSATHHISVFKQDKVCKKHGAKFRMIANFVNSSN